MTSDNDSDSDDDSSSTGSIDLLAPAPKKREAPNKQNVSNDAASAAANKRLKTNDHDDTTSSTTASTSIAAVPANVATTSSKSLLKQNEQESTSTTTKSTTATIASSQKVPDAIIPQLVSTSPASNVRWTVYRDCVLVRTDRTIKEEKRTKAAAFDLDGTLLVWRCAGWPSKPEHYELWNTRVIEKLQHYHDAGYQLIIVTNQGGIRSAFAGKTASRIKGLIDWLARVVKRPITAVVSTSTKSGYHKPSPKMWHVCQEIWNSGIEFDLSSSFYVGDSDGSGENNDKYQDSGVDKEFAENVGKMKNGAVLKFQTPLECFGECDAERRKEAALASKQLEYDAPPQEALQTLAALLGGYLQGPILLILCGVQGSGKSTFCQELLKCDDSHWVHLSQDTINNGKPGKREKVEEAALESLKNNKSVVVDRMHLDPDQRLYFIQVAQKANVPAHALWLNPSKSIIEQRVRDRTNHAGKVQGRDGVKLANVSLQRIIKPLYKEGLDLISVISSDYEVQSICDKYRRVCNETRQEDGTKTHLPGEFILNQESKIKLPSIALGTMKLGKRVASSVVSSSGFSAVDTAPTYNNEIEVGDGLPDNCFVIVKVPKRATQPSQVREELLTSLKKLQRPTADLVLLHWPCDFIEAGTLEVAWKELETLVKEGKARALGVCNFSVQALRLLLPMCSVAKPVVNQVERHLLLPQWDLLDFCKNRGILVQAHTALGQGRDELLQHPTLVKIAQASSLTPAQVLVSWNLQQGIAVVTKCSSESHQKEILKLPENKEILGPEEMKELDGMSKSSQTRFVAPPFMYKPGAPYSWGDRMPSKSAQ